MSSLAAILPLLWVASAPAGDVSVRILAALELPRAAEELRIVGVPVVEVRELVLVGRNDHVHAGDFVIVLFGARDDVRRYGHIDNFGSFVQDCHHRGLYGRDLADAIHHEHAKRGKGHWKHGGHHDDRAILLHDPRPGVSVEIDLHGGRPVHSPTVHGHQGGPHGGGPPGHKGGPKGKGK